MILLVDLYVDVSVDMTTTMMMPPMADYDYYDYYYVDIYMHSQGPFKSRCSYSN